MPITKAHYIVIGVGNPDRGDDAAGRKVAQRLYRMLPPEVEILEHSGEATSLLSHFEDAAMAVLIDACASAAPAGTVQRFDTHAAALPQGAFNLSTHGFGLAEAIELARSLEQLPPRCIVYAIEGESFEQGAPLSAAVSTSINEVTDRVCTEIREAIAMGSRIDA